MTKQITHSLDKVITVTINENHELLAIGEQKGHSTRVAFIKRKNTGIQPYVVAWGYDVNTATWNQGHYFDDRVQAYLCYIEYIEGNNVSRETF